MIRRWAIAVVLGGLGVARPGVVAAPAAAPVPVVVELFTSEGCSSCPPADAVLVDLVEHQPVSGAVVIALSEHVDYWDQQGWRDPFSSHAFTQRQSAYAAAGGGSDVYTPQMFVDGGQGFVGSDRSAALAAIKRAAARPKTGVTLELSAETRSALTVTIPASRATAGAQVWLAIVEDGLTSAVTGGENAGHALRHAAVTRRFVSLGKTDKDGGLVREAPLDLDPRWHREALHAVAIVQSGSVGPIVASGSIQLGRATGR